MEFVIDVPEFAISPLVALVLFYRKRRYGYAFRRIRLTEGKFAIVDAEDYEGLNKYCWYVTCVGYPGTNEKINGVARTTLMHRKIMRPGKEFVVDHKNRNPLDNRRDNLRIATKAQNACNRKTISHSSRFRGVCWYKRHKKWQAAINLRGKTIFLGYFSDEVEAAKAYDKAARKYHGEFASLNFTEDPQAGLGAKLCRWKR